MDYRKQRLFTLLLAMVTAVAVLVAVIGLTDNAAGAQQESGLIPRASIRNLRAGEDGLTFTLVTPVMPVSRAAKTSSQLQVEGLEGRTSLPGTPSLPYYSTYVALPPGSVPRIKVLQADAIVQKGVALSPVTAEVVEVAPFFDEAPRPSNLVERALAEAASPEPTSVPSGLYPASIVEISEPMMLRDIRLARISVYPMRYDVYEQTLSVAPEIEITVDFVTDGPAHRRLLATSHNDRHLKTAADLVINPDQLSAFRSLPDALDSTGTPLPLGVDLFKIGVAEDGIYELTYESLADAGMAVGEVDPATIEMLYRGMPVATSFVGDSDADFEPGESIRFYGHAFNGSRLERQFINENFFWLWAGEEAKAIQSKPSVAGQPITSYLSTTTHEPENVYFPGFTAEWPENEPDAWYWEWFPFRQTPVSRTFTITLQNQASAGPPAQFTAEFTAKDSHISDAYHNVSVSMNGHPNIGGREWWGEQNFNVTATVPLSNVLAGWNEFEVTAQTEGVVAHLALNRITVEYQRALAAEEDQLIFTGAATESRRYTVADFSQPDEKDILIWDITHPYSPTAITTSTVIVTGDGPYSYTFGVEAADNVHLIATTLAKILTPATISRVVANDLDPPGGADWVAIAYKAFITETERLASHRSQATFGGLSTHVVDVQDIINAYGYGLPLPGAIQDYLIHAMANWPLKPSYVTLVGDTTLDPRHINDDWNDQQYLPTDLVFVDRYNGLIPSDFRYSLVSGADKLPDLAVGRLAVENEEELASAIDKIIRYDENQLLSFGWMQNMLFLGDETDPSAGDFCHENLMLSERLPASLNSTFLCRDDYGSGVQETDELRADLISFLEDDGATLLTYRGHGAVNAWGGNPVIFSLANVPELNNERPFVAVSGDCLDGHYAYPRYEGLGERLVSSIVPPEEIAGAAAHWGSSGLGVSSHHSSILNGFYDGLFTGGATALGDAVIYAKMAYAQDIWNDPALLYSFNLQGDPAMQLMRPNIELSGEWLQDYARVGERVDLSLDVWNHGVYPAQITLDGNALPGFSIASVSSTVSSTTSTVGGGVEIALQFGDTPRDSGFPRHGQATITITYELTPGLPLGLRNGSFVALSPGIDAWPGNENISRDIHVLKESIWLPAINR